MKVRALFVSDVHLGTRGYQAELLLDFLNHCECDRISSATSSTAGG